MTVTVSDLLDSVDLQPQGPILWSEMSRRLSELRDLCPGVYFVSLSKSPDSIHDTIPTAPICYKAVQDWICRVPELEIDGHSPNSPEEIALRLQEFWLPNENILYIGNSGSIKRRIGQLNSHIMGDRNPHWGGHWKRLLSNLDELYIHYAYTSNQSKTANELKKILLEEFKKEAYLHIDHDSRVANCAVPFANIDGPGCRKKHGLSNQVLL